MHQDLINRALERQKVALVRAHEPKTSGRQDTPALRPAPTSEAEGLGSTRVRHEHEAGISAQRPTKTSRGDGNHALDQLLTLSTNDLLDSIKRRVQSGTGRSELDELLAEKRAAESTPTFQFESKTTGVTERASVAGIATRLDDPTIQAPTAPPEEAFPPRRAQSATDNGNRYGISEPYLPPAIGDISLFTQPPEPPKTAPGEVDILPELSQLEFLSPPESALPFPGDPPQSTPTHGPSTPGLLPDLSELVFSADSEAEPFNARYELAGFEETDSLTFWPAPEETGPTLPPDLSDLALNSYLYSDSPLPPPESTAPFPAPDGRGSVSGDPGETSGPEDTNPLLPVAELETGVPGDEASEEEPAESSGSPAPKRRWGRRVR